MAWSAVGLQLALALATTLFPSPDLSFNNISEVGEGLQGLVQLRDLSLAHNQLTGISGLQGLACLQSLSLASNRLQDLDQVGRLRPLSALQSLSLSGNPLATDPSYQHYCIAFLPSLVYLDYSMIFPEQVSW
jgi:Leucine-rich repeat (LRR) protein